jgi:hypothetical protein
MKLARLVSAAVVVALSVSGGGVASASSRVRGHGGPISERLRTTAGSVTSTNWSGYAAHGATFSDVSGSWQQPAANCTSVPGRTVALSAFWVGLDGYLSNTVEQAGTEADCVGTSPRYYAWYEFYPHRLFVLSETAYPVSPRDRLSARVSQATNSVTVILTDQTQRWTYTTTVPAKHLTFSSAEWIAEGPSNELADFGSVDFSAATASTDGVTQRPIDSFSNDAITMQTHSGIVRATPSPPPVATGFLVTWQHT